MVCLANIDKGAGENVCKIINYATNGYVLSNVKNVYEYSNTFIW